MRPNREFLKSLRTPVAHFYLCDLHVHSVGSADVAIGARYDALPTDIQCRLPKLDKEPTDTARYDADVENRVPIDVFYNQLLCRRDAVATEQSLEETDNWAIIGVTDHNTCTYSCRLAEYAWERRSQNRLVILPGIELDVHFPLPVTDSQDCRVHLLSLFQPETFASDIRIAINDARQSSPAWQPGQPVRTANLPAFVNALRHHASYPAICIAAHVWSSKGIAAEPRKLILDSLEAEIARLEGARQDSTEGERRELDRQLEQLVSRKNATDDLALDVLRLIGSCGFDALQVREKSDERHYRRLHRFREEHGRASPLIASDAHSPSSVFTCAGGVPFAKVTRAPASMSSPELFKEIRDHTLRYGETRLTCSTPGQVTHWIEGLEIIPDAQDARNFWPVGTGNHQDASEPVEASFILPLSRNLNCLIGGRGSGKSAAIEAIAFVAAPQQFTDKAQQKSEWYGRAVSTLRGCQVRLCWKTTDSEGFSRLPKRALFTTRYFNPTNQHRSVELRDAGDKLVADSEITQPKISIFRVHEIEEAARPDRLRQLFDDLCGSRVEQLNLQVAQLRDTLTAQRTDILAICQQLAALTSEGSPLRQYAIRKQQFLEVDKPEIRAKYEKVDQADAATAIAHGMVETWQTLALPATLSEAQQNVEQFFEASKAKIVDESGDPKPNCSSLAALFLDPADELDSPGMKKALLAPLADAHTHLTTFEATLASTSVDLQAAADQVRDSLAAEGLPPGSRDREAKKRAFEEAQADLEIYRAKLVEYDMLIQERRTHHEQLVAACKERTDLRRETAERLSSNLARDLDHEVLVIEVDAQPMADKADYHRWMLSGFEPVFKRYRQNRCAALIEAGVMPAEIRSILFREADADQTRLRVNKDRAEDGRITSQEAEQLLTLCQARVRITADTPEGAGEAFFSELPLDVSEGLWAFPIRDGNADDLCIDTALQLDELVLDDMPTIRLNDRPLDAGSTARPLAELSPGQRCSAILPILLLTGDSPLVIDQPEDNLDNRLIRQVIVNILASMKLRRQVIVATHNPNLPVLGDAEQSIVLQATGRDEAAVVALGDLDSPKVARYITDIMEGGREAFQYRHTIYKAHWDSVVDDGDSA